jgi:hypothetical protein
MRRALTLVALLPFVLGCGAKSGSDLDDASAALSDAGSSRVEITVSSGKKRVLEASGVFDYRRDVGELELVAFDASFAGVDMPWPVAFRLIGRDVYTGWRFGDKLRWQKEEEWEPRDAEELIVPFEGGPAPDRVLELLLKASKRTQIFASEEIRGVKAKHYRLHIDEDALLRDYGIENGLDGPPPPPVVVDAWIDDDNLVRRLVFPQGAEEGAREEATFDFFDFGIAVDVKAPQPPDLISRREFDKLMKQECRSRKKADQKPGEFCSYITGERSDGPTSYGPVETVPAP